MSDNLKDQMRYSLGSMQSAWVVPPVSRCLSIKTTWSNVYLTPVQKPHTVALYGAFVLPKHFELAIGAKLYQCVTYVVKCIFQIVASVSDPKSGAFSTQRLVVSLNCSKCVNCVHLRLTWLNSTTIRTRQF